MIGWLKGEVIGPQLVRTSADVGYVVTCAHPLRVGAQVELFITTIVREDAISLYGFETLLEQQCFADLINAQGVGPQLAMNVLRELGVARFAAAVRDEDVATLRKVPGLGPQSAKKLLASIKLSAAVAATADIQGVGDEAADSAMFDPMVDALAATLEGLGYERDEAVAAVSRVRAEQPDADESAVLSAALVALRQAA